MSAADTISANVMRRGSAVRLSLLVAGVIAALALIDEGLEKAEQNELAALALRANQNGETLLARGRAAEAVDAFRRAHSLERENAKYELDLIQGLMAAGKLAEAQPLMSELLEEESNNGEANLVAARLAAEHGQINSADSYYHRAIYGEWPHSLNQHQTQVRLELIDFLNAHNKQNEVLAELLPLEEQAGTDTKLQSRLAQLFLKAGSPSRARDIFQRLIKLDPEDKADYVGLGEADLALGDFRAAHTAFSSAVSRNGNDAVLRRRLDLSMMVMNLDPTVRWLSSQEKYRRCREILQLASNDLEQCVTNHPQLATQEATQLTLATQKELGSPPVKQPTNEIAESTLSLAEAVWRARTSLCGTSTASDEEPIRLILDKLAK